MMKRKIIFRIFPFNQLSFPLLLNVWEKKGIDSKFNIIIARSTSEMGNITPSDVILYSFMTHHIPIVASDIQNLKEFQPLIVGGGPHITGEQELAFQLGFDVLFTGHGENSFLQFGYDLLEEKDVKGKIYKESENNCFNDYIPVTSYLKTIPPLEIMRGCHWNCRYCQTGNSTPYFREMDSIRQYFTELKKRNYSRVNFISPSSLEFKNLKTATNDYSGLEELLSTAQEFEFNFIEYGIFPSEIRPDTVNEKVIKILSKYVTNNRLTIGVQSSSEKVLKRINRGHNLKDIEKSIQIINSAGFLATLDFIIALPDETKKDREHIIRFIRNLLSKYRIAVQFHHFFPISGCNFSNRFPSFLESDEKEKFIQFNASGVSTASWIVGEKIALDYFNWLKSEFPKFYKKFK